MLLGLNIGKNAATPIEQATDDYLTCLDGVYPHADYVTVNISSPNTKNLRALQGDEALDALLGAIEQRRQLLAQRHARTDATGTKQPRLVPIFVKIAPDLEPAQVEVIAATLKRYGLNKAGQPNQNWGVVATNTTLSRSAVQGLPHADEAGGLSGAPVREASTRIVRQLRAALGMGFPIIGVGGIMSAQDAVEKIQAGADVVQIYTGLIYQGPKLIGQAARAIRDNR
jgi:dihydroorotate dehydrogenase